MKKLLKRVLVALIIVAIVFWTATMCWGQIIDKAPYSLDL